MSKMTVCLGKRFFKNDHLFGNMEESWRYQKEEQAKPGRATGKPAKA